jgi:hypothetical protein
MKYAFISLTLILLFLPVSSFASERDEVLEKSRLTFGEPVDLSENLYEINRFYVFQPIFDAQNKVEELKVIPKYYFEDSHPEWEEPKDFIYLTVAEYQELLEKLDKIKSKGALVEKGNISVATNATAWFTDKYKNAAVTRGQIVDLRLPDDAPIEIKWIKVQFKK